jgi:hypothetical protein
MLPGETFRSVSFFLTYKSFDVMREGDGTGEIDIYIHQSGEKCHPENDMHISQESQDWIKND